MEFHRSATPHQLEGVLEHASQITRLKLFIFKLPVDFRWQRLHVLEELSFSYGSTGLGRGIYRGIAHPNSRLRKLDVGDMPFREPLL